VNNKRNLICSKSTQWLPVSYLIRAKPAANKNVVKNRPPQHLKVSVFIFLKPKVGKYEKETTASAEAGSLLKKGRWTRDEHFRFIEGLKLYGKEWRKVQFHVQTRTSTQARSHAQKFFVKLESRNITLESFLVDLDLGNLEKDMLFSDDEEIPKAKITKIDSVSAAHIMTQDGTVEGESAEIANVKLSVLRKKSVLNFAIPKMEMKPVSPP
jgi:SHAQKYF class myb-like DNA-binding protein